MKNNDTKIAELTKKSEKSVAIEFDDLKLIKQVERKLNELPVLTKPELKQWKPKEGEDYYYIAWVASEGFVTMVETWLEHESFNPKVWEAGNCFRTEEEAQQVIDQLNEALERSQMRRKHPQ